MRTQRVAAPRRMEGGVNAFVAAGLANLAASCRFRFWPQGIVSRGILETRLLPATGEFVDFVATIQQAVSLPMTGVVDAATWAAMRRHVSANTPLARLIGQFITTAGDVDSLPVKLCGEARPRGQYALRGASEAEMAKARAESATAAFRVADLHQERNRVVAIGQRRRVGNNSTEVFGLTWNEVLKAALWNGYIAALSPSARTAYPTAPASRVGLRVRRSGPIKSVGSAELVLLVAKWELTKGWPPRGALTAPVANAIKAEMEADTPWGRDFRRVIMFASTKPTGATQADIRRAAQAGTRSAGVVSNLQPQLVQDQAAATQAQRIAGQVVRAQYDRAGSAAASSAGLLQRRGTNIVSALSREARMRTAATAGRTGFVDPRVARAFVSPTFDYGAGLITTPGGSTAAQDDQETATTTPADVRMDSGDAAPAPPAPNGGSAGAGPTPYQPGDVWSSATAEEVAAAQRWDEEDAWAFDGGAAGGGARGGAAPGGAGSEGAEALPEGVPPEDVPGVSPSKKGGKGLFVVAGLAVLGYFLFRK